MEVTGKTDLNPVVLALMGLLPFKGSAHIPYTVLNGAKIQITVSGVELEIECTPTGINVKNKHTE